MIYDLVIYHKLCPDGTCAAWCYEHWLELNGISQGKSQEVAHPAIGYPDFYPMNAGGFLELDYTGKQVLLVDISFKRPDLLKVAEVAKSVTILDHHKTAIDDLKDLPPNVHVTFDLKRSGAQISWDTFFPGIVRPWFVDSIGDRDLWTWKLPNTKPLSMYFSMHNMYNSESYNKMLEMSNGEIEEMVRVGLLIEKFAQKQIEEMASGAKLCKFGPHVVYVVQCQFMEYASELGNFLALKPECDFAVVVCYNLFKDGIKLSLRAVKDEIDLTTIVKPFGGGGHAKASGCWLNSREDFVHLFTPV